MFLIWQICHHDDVNLPMVRDDFLEAKCTSFVLLGTYTSRYYVREFAKEATTTFYKRWYKLFLNKVSSHRKSKGNSLLQTYLPVYRESWIFINCWTYHTFQTCSNLSTKLGFCSFRIGICQANKLTTSLWK